MMRLLTLSGFQRVSLAGLLLGAGLIIMSVDCLMAQPPKPVFDGQSAFTILYEQVKLGSRVPGSKAHDDAVAWFTEWFEESGATVKHQKFHAAIPQHPTPDSDFRSVEGVNIIARFGSKHIPDMLLCAHYDCRPWADSDPDPSKWSQPIPGANDGASGVAVLMELARLFAENPPPITVEIVLFDLEDAGIEGDNASWAIGSSHFAKHYAGSAPAKAILLDMIGDSDLQIKQEYFSLVYAREWTEEIFRVAEEVGSWAFDPQPGQAVYDDHVPLLKAGFQIVDLIDFDYPYWHTMMDSPAACSAQSLEQVGRVLVHLIYN